MSVPSSVAVPARRYSRVAIFLHWTIAALLVCQLALGWRMHESSGPERTALLSGHKFIGVGILLLSLGRLAWRLLHQPPADVDLNRIERSLSSWVHRAFYALLIVLPLTGWIMISIGRPGAGIRLLGFLPWPRVPLIGLLSPELQEKLGDLAGSAHTALVWLLLFLLALHVAGALKHQLWSSDAVMARMVPGLKPGLRLQPWLLSIPLVALAAIGTAYAVRPLNTAPPRPKITQVATADAYLDLVQPALVRRCSACHNDDRSRGGLSVVSFESLMAGGLHGPVVVKGQSARSELIRRITLDPAHRQFMPAGGRAPMSASQIQTLKWWVSAGAPSGGLVQTFEVKDDSRLALEQVLHLAPELEEGATSVEPLPVVAQADAAVVTALESGGYTIRPVSSGSHLIDVNRFRRNPVTDEELASLARLSIQIRTLSLRASGVTDAQLGALKQMPNLVLLKLDENPIGDEGLGHLSDLPALRALSLTGTRVTERGVASLAPLPRLEKVYVWNTGIQTGSLDKLRAQNPRLSVEGEYSESR